MKVIMTKGLPASGKTTWAKEIINQNPNSYKRINKDELRAMLDDSRHSNDAEKFILKVRDALILMALEEGKHVIVDDTNLAPKHEERIRQLIKGRAILEVKDFTDVDLNICIKRDLQRPASVGESVIRGMHRQFLQKHNPYIEDISLPHAIIVDIDGTLALMNGRSPYDWLKVKEDKVNHTIMNIVDQYRTTDNSIILFSGRDAVCETQTREWLTENNVWFDALFMRPEGNTEKDAIIKQRMFDENIRGKYYIEYVLDDRQQVVDMWRSLGLTCLQVAEGDF